MSIPDENHPARRAVDELQQVAQHGRDLCPPDRDPQEWAGAVLDDLARVAGLLDDAVVRVSGKRNETVAENSQVLAGVISAHRNLEVGPPA